MNLFSIFWIIVGVIIGVFMLSALYEADLSDGDIMVNGVKYICEARNGN